MTPTPLVVVGLDNPRRSVSATRAINNQSRHMTSTRRKDSSGRVTLSDQELAHELQQFSALAGELSSRIEEFMSQINVRATVLSSVVSAHRSSRACTNHLRAASLLADSDV